MDIKANYADLNAFFKVAGIGMTVHGISDNSLELTYDLGALLPSITLKLHKRGFVSNYVPFKYEVQGMSSFMFSLANFFFVTIVFCNDTVKFTSIEECN